MHDGHTRLMDCQRVREIACAIGGVVVHHQHVQVRLSAQDLAHESVQVLALVVCRYDDNAALGRLTAVSLYCLPHIPNQKAHCARQSIGSSSLRRDTSFELWAWGGTLRGVTGAGAADEI